MTPAGFVGLPKIKDLLNYQISRVESDIKPINREKLLEGLAQLVRMRANLAANFLHDRKIKEAGIQIALAQVYLGLIESIRKGKYD